MKTVAPDGSVLQVSVDEIRVSAANPRREFSQEAMAALTDSVKAYGVLQPVVVRYRDEDLELVCGHRRLAAARAAGLDTIPAVLRHITAADAFDMAMAENLQREDLTEIDEAEAYQACRAHGDTVEAIALKAGRSVAHVYQRLKLLDLPDAARAALKDGRLSLAVAVLIGRIPGATQREEATEKVLAGARITVWRSEDEGGPVREPMSYQAARQLLVDGYMLTLASAPFDVNDPDLVPAAGSCATCHHRTGNQKDLFGDVLAEGGADVCTYPTCYHAKRDAHAAAVCGGTGLKQLKASEMDKAFVPGSDSIAWNGKYVDADKPLNSWPIETGKKTLRKALGEHAPTEFAAVDGKGQLRHLYRRKDVTAAYDAMKPQGETAESKTSRAARENMEAARVCDATVAEIKKAIVARGLNHDGLNAERLLRCVAADVLYNSSWVPDPAHGVVLGDRGSLDVTWKGLKSVGLEKLVVLMAEVLSARMVYEAAEAYVDESEEDVWAELQKIYGFKLEDIRKKVEADLAHRDEPVMAQAQAPVSAVAKPGSVQKKKPAKKVAKTTKKAAKKPAKKARAKR